MQCATAAPYSLKDNVILDYGDQEREAGLQGHLAESDVKALRARVRPPDSCHHAGRDHLSLASAQRSPPGNRKAEVYFIM